MLLFYLFCIFCIVLLKHMQELYISSAAAKHSFATGSPCAPYLFIYSLMWFMTQHIEYAPLVQFLAMLLWCNLWLEQ